MNIRFVSRLFVIGLAGVLAGSVPAQGPTSALYVISRGDKKGGGNFLNRIQGLSVLSSGTKSNSDFCVGVSGDVRTFGSDSGSSGSQFDLDGNLLALGLYANLTSGAYYDGTSDGNFNYAVDNGTGDVIQFDRDWANPTTLFNASSSSYALWITMNAGDGSFWIAGNSVSTIEHYSHAGALLDSFDTGFTKSLIAGLAFDRADGTLWMSRTMSKGQFYQFDQVGNLLQTASYTIPGSFTTYGMEFNEAVPEPASTVALTLGLAAFIRRRTKK